MVIAMAFFVFSNGRKSVKSPKIERIKK